MLLLLPIEAGPMGISVAPVRADSINDDGPCNGLQVVLSPSSSALHFQRNDIIIRLNGSSLAQLSCIDALNLLKSTQHRTVAVIRKAPLPATGRKEEKDEEDAISSKWHELKRRYLYAIVDRNFFTDGRLLIRDRNQTRQPVLVRVSLGRDDDGYTQALQSIRQRLAR